uniref:Thiamine phosphate synthase/TenI domain-containing protein n=1 Tax=Lotharella oceanica TaxID=641309 RepID=A0A7S2XEY2_9EUKA|mmetsp:Transcript_35060/g.64944  ORF Transcript_35060/g.64944 Transcript_35060/m.64944 type:complete len:234 (+) Transcript_35060:3-704(+)
MTTSRAFPRLLAVSPGTHLRPRDLRPLIQRLGARGLPAILLREPQLTDDEMKSLHATASDHIPLVIVHAKHPLAYSLSENIHIASPFSRGGAPAGWAAFERLADVRRNVKGVLGVSCHEPSEVAHAIEAGAEYATLSPVWETKKGLSLVGVDRYVHSSATTAEKDDRKPTSYFKSGCPPACLALGGATPERFGDLLAAGGHGIAFMGDLWSAGDDDAVEAKLTEFIQVAAAAI